MRSKTLNYIRIAAGCIPLAFLAALLIHYAATGGSLSVADILNYTPSEPLLAALVMIGFFLCKSLSIFFPVSVLCLACGLMFPPLAALLVILTGLGGGTALMYGMGRLLGLDAVQKLMSRYKKAQQLQRFQNGSPFLFVFAVRIMGILPCDVVSLYMGSTGVPFWPYLWGGLLGFLPVAAIELLIGRSMRDVGSPVFWLSLGLRAALTVGSLLLCRRKFRQAGAAE